MQAPAPESTPAPETPVVGEPKAEEKPAGAADAAPGELISEAELDKLMKEVGLDPASVKPESPVAEPAPAKEEKPSGEKASKEKAGEGKPGNEQEKPAVQAGKEKSGGFYDPAVDFEFKNLK